jgi:hypothetical protein
MDLFRFTNPNEPALMEQGVFVEDTDSKLWVERYAEPGEFEVVARLDTGIKQKLPLGSLVSHVDTPEIMVVENHEISDDGEDPPKLVVTGRGFDSFFEQRAVGSNQAFPTGVLDFYLVNEDFTWVQAVDLIKNHIQLAQLQDPADAIPHFDVVETITGAGTIEPRIFPREMLSKVLADLLAIDDLGIKVCRPGRSGVPGVAPTDSAFVIHKGVDKSASVIFSKGLGDVVSAEYLWSQKPIKTSAYLHGKWVDTIVHQLPLRNQLDRRWMSVDLSEIDGNFDEPPGEEARGLIVLSMHIIGRALLASQKEVALSKVEVSKDAIAAKYRTHYNVGDLVTVTGDYNESSVMRVTEHAEIDDDEGTRSYPTLSASEGA